ncbi:MAG TPA: glycosyltransferase family 39 protein [Candidatus Sulfotelmatobacter sp.]|nr:glycosyltransferase family 39 protein [Candidatus Sulfotelmatobacter sp.]
MIKNKSILFSLLFFAVFLASLLRFWQLGKIPISPDWDEVALGYSAYSILHTGRDEYGKFLPVVLRSYDDYKPALYTYLIIPFLPLFDLSVFAVRFPSALLGVLGVLAVFFILRRLFDGFKYRDYLSLLASFLFAVSPWDIQFSRVAFESHVGAIFNILVVLFFVKGVKKPWFLCLSAIFAGLSLYVYQSEKVFTPLLVLVLVLVYRHDILNHGKKYFLTALVLGAIVVLPMVFYIVNNRQALLRVTGTSVFSEQTQLLQNNIEKLERDHQTNDKIGLVLDNRRFVYATTIVSGYISHYYLNWLFITGDLVRHHAPNMGLLYLWEFPFIFIGMYYLIFGEFDKKTKLLIFAWYLIVPIPASITSGVPHAVRTMNFLPLYEVFTALGIIYSLMNLVKINKKLFGLKVWKIITILYFLFVIFNFSYYLNQYFSQQNFFSAKDWQYGWEPTVNYIKQIQGKYKKILVSDKEPLDRSYMFFAFYLKYPPNKYQKYGVKESGGFAETHYFDKFEFRPLNYEKDSKDPNALLIGTPHEFPGSITPLKTIRYPNKDAVIEIVGK